MRAKERGIDCNGKRTQIEWIEGKKGHIDL
jgi:hypothetical protein